jgi:hypothetical protein
MLAKPRKQTSAAFTRKAEQDALDEMLRILGELGSFLDQRKAELEQVCQVRDRLYRLTVTAKANARGRRRLAPVLPELLAINRDLISSLRENPYFAPLAASLSEVMRRLALRRGEKNPLKSLKARAEELWKSGEYPSKNNVVEALRQEIVSLVKQIEPNQAEQRERVETYCGTLRKFLQKLGPPPSR